MKKTLALFVALALALFGCGDDDNGEEADAITPEAHSDQLSEWAEQFDADLTRADDYEGHEVWLDEDQQTVYVQDCAAGEKITGEGGPYGPTPRNDDGTGGANGWGLVCQD